MKIVTTPMCEEIVKLAGISNYVVNKYPDEEDGDLAILLSESKVEMDSLPIKLNTPVQVFESIKKVSKVAQNELSDEEINSFFEDYELSSKYLNSHFNVVFPDYLKDNVIETDNLVEIPSHGFVSKNPFERIEVRYSILENLI